VKLRDLADPVGDNIKVLPSAVDVEKDLRMLWLCDSREDSHELAILPSHDFIVVIFTFSVDTFQNGGSLVLTNGWWLEV